METIHRYDATGRRVQVARAGHKRRGAFIASMLLPKRLFCRLYGHHLVPWVDAVGAPNGAVSCVFCRRGWT